MRRAKKGGTDYGWKALEVRGDTVVGVRDATAAEILRLIKPPLKLRISLAMAGTHSMSYFDLMHAVFPPAQYPRAYRYQSNGGPPGCAMAFGKALRELGASWNQVLRLVPATQAMRQLAREAGRL